MKQQEDATDGEEQALRRAYHLSLKSVFRNCYSARHRLHTKQYSGSQGEHTLGVKGTALMHKNIRTSDQVRMIKYLVEPDGLEPTTSCMPCKRSPN